MSTPLPRSLLFVPAARPDRYDKARGSGADAVCIDLEDAVAPAARAEARSALVRWLDAERSPIGSAVPLLGVRVNALTGRDGLEDVLALDPVQHRLDFLMLPKVDDPFAITQLARLLPEVPEVVPLIESPLGVERALALLTGADLRLAMFGGVDYAAEAGVRFGWEGMLGARSRLANAAAAAGVHLFDAPYIDVADLAGLERETALARDLGIPARAAIHPTQIPVIHDALAPGAEALAQAERVLEAFAAAGDGVALLDGRLIEKPVVDAARRTLAAAGLPAGRGTSGG